MELTVNKAGKYALVWLTNAEKADPKVMDSLQPLIEQCKEKKYRLAIFESGEQCFAKTGIRNKVASGDSPDTTSHRFFLPPIG